MMISSPIPKYPSLAKDRYTHRKEEDAMADEMREGKSAMDACLCRAS